MACAEGGSARQIAERLPVPIRRVERWRGRFRQQRLDGLRDRPRRGHPPIFTPVMRCEIIALACEPVRTTPGPIRRTLAQIREAAIARAIVPTIGTTTIQRILTQGEVRPHLVRGWLHSPDPAFREKVTEICACICIRRSAARCSVWMR